MHVVCWISKTSVFCLSGHLSAHLSSAICISDFFDFFHVVRNIQKSRPISVEKDNKKWAFRFFEKFYDLNLLEMILNESSYNFRFLIKNPPHIYSGKLLILIYYPKCSQSIKMQHFLNFNTHETMELWSYFFSYG